MKHSYPPVEVPAGAAFAEQICSKCGTVRYKHAKGYFFYRSSMGGITPTGPKCTVDLKPASQVAPKATAAESVIPVYMGRSSLSEPEAKLQEAIVIINLLYEDLVIHGIRTRGRVMAGTYLHSHGYTELLNALNEKVKS